MEYVEVNLTEEEKKVVVSEIIDSIRSLQQMSGNKRYVNHLFFLNKRIISGKKKFTSKQACHISIHLKKKTDRDTFLGKRLNSEA